MHWVSHRASSTSRRSPKHARGKAFTADTGYDSNAIRNQLEALRIKKRFRAIATRFEKGARNFLALIHLACSMIWLQDLLGGA